MTETLISFFTSLNITGLISLIENAVLSIFIYSSFKRSKKTYKIMFYPCAFIVFGEIIKDVIIACISFSEMNTIGLGRLRTLIFSLFTYNYFIRGLALFWILCDSFPKQRNAIMILFMNKAADKYGSYYHNDPYYSSIFGVALSYIHDIKPGVEFLLKLGADINAIDIHGDTVLHKACTDNNTDIAMMILESCAFGNNIDAAGYMTKTPLYIACEHKNKIIMEELLKRNADPDYEVVTKTPLHIVPQFRFPKYKGLTKLLLEYGAVPDYKDMYGHSPMYYACRVGDIEAILLYLKHGVNYNDVYNTNHIMTLQRAKEIYFVDVKRDIKDMNIVIDDLIQPILSYI